MHIYILDFRPWKWSALNMEFVVKWPSRMQGQYFFQSWAGRAAVFGRDQIFPWRLPLPGSDTPIIRGELNVRLVAILLNNFDQWINKSYRTSSSPVSRPIDVVQNSQDPRLGLYPAVKLHPKRLHTESIITVKLKILHYLKKPLENPSPLDSQES